LVSQQSGTRSISPEIIITQAAYDEVKDAVAVEPMEPIRVKGKSEPIPVYRVVRRLTASV